MDTRWNARISQESPMENHRNLVRPVGGSHFAARTAKVWYQQCRVVFFFDDGALAFDSGGSTDFGCLVAIFWVENEK